MDYTQEIKNLNDRMQKLEYARDNEWLYHSVKEVREYLGKMQNEFQSVLNRLEAFEKKYLVEDISHDLINKLWKSAGINLDEIANHFKIEMNTASGWVNGQLKDQRKRYELKKFLELRMAKI